MHPTSLPGPYGIGELGAEAHAFADFLRDSGQRIWQVLPLGPTGYGDSPYQCFSAFAGNALLISIDALVQRGYLEGRDLAGRPDFTVDTVDYGVVIAWKMPVLRKAFDRFRRAGASEQEEFQSFCQRHASWLDDFALFIALKQEHDLVIWSEWPRELALREPAALERARDRLRDEIECQKFIQFEFERQWCDLKAHCTRNDIRILGDMPIYVALDSAPMGAGIEIKPNYAGNMNPDYQTPNYQEPAD